MATGNADQADGRKIATSTQAEMQAQISPNGRRIALVSLRTGQSEIWIAEADGSSATQLTSLGQHVTTTGSVACGSPRWSPDGRQIAFDARIDSPADIYVIDSQGGLARRLTDWDSVESRPSWSHDGGWIYFNSDQGGSYEIWKIPAGGGEAVQVTSNGGYNPVESPDGRYLYFGKRREPGIWRMPVEGGTETLVVADIEGAAQGYFDIANDGVYFIDRAGSSRYRQGWQLSYLDLGSGKPRHIANLPAPPAGAIPLDTAPDGSWFVYAQRDESDFDLMLVENFR